jgi:hypothetical protein
MIFSETIREIKLNRVRDLKKIVEHLKGFTFQGGDSSKIHEFFCLYIFLIGSFKLGKLSLPVKIISKESPDFTIAYEDQNKEIGLEHTKATLESFKIAESELKKHPEGSLIELCYYSPFVKIPKKQSDIGIVSPKGHLRGEGWNGNQVEHEWSEIILNTVKKKTELLNEEHFEIKKENTLFIEDDSPVDFVKHEDDAIQILKQKFNQEKLTAKHIFDNVHIFSNCTLIYDVFGECIKVGLRKKELPDL